MYYWGSIKFLIEWWGFHCSKRGGETAPPPPGPGPEPEQGLEEEVVAYK